MSDFSFWWVPKRQRPSTPVPKPPSPGAREGSDPLEPHSNSSEPFPPVTGGDSQGFCTELEVSGSPLTLTPADATLSPFSPATPLVATHHSDSRNSGSPLATRHQPAATRTKGASHVPAPIRKPLPAQRRRQPPMSHDPHFRRHPAMSHARAPGTRRARFAPRRRQRPPRSHRRFPHRCRRQSRPRPHLHSARW